MNRRGFLSLLGQVAVGATVAYSFPSIIVPKNIQPAYLNAPNGLAYLLGDTSRVYAGLTTTAFPDLNSPVVDYSGMVLSREMFEAARKSLNNMIWQTRENGLLMR